MPSGLKGNSVALTRRSRVPPPKPPPSRHAQGAEGDRAWRWRRSAARSADGWRQQEVRWFGWWRGSGRRKPTQSTHRSSLSRTLANQRRYHGATSCTSERVLCKKTKLEQSWLWSDIPFLWLSSFNERSFRNNLCSLRAIEYVSAYARTTHLGPVCNELAPRVDEHCVRAGSESRKTSGDRTPVIRIAEFATWC